jgi:hypothetical protein
MVPGITPDAFARRMIEAYVAKGVQGEAAEDRAELCGEGNGAAGGEGETTATGAGFMTDTKPTR